MTPFLPSTPLADFSQKIPEAVQRAGLDLRVFTPCYGHINTRRHQLHDVIRLSGINIIVNDTDFPLTAKVASIPGSHLQVYFVDNDEFFQRKSKFKISPKFPASNFERSIFFIRGAFEAINKLRWIPDVIHCVGWFAALAPLYLRTYYKDSPCLGKAKVIFSTAPEEDHDTLGENLLEITSFDKINSELLEPIASEISLDNLRKLGIRHADGVSFIAENETEVATLATYAKELEKPMIVVSPDADEDGKKHSEFYRSIL